MLKLFNCRGMDEDDDIKWVLVADTSTKCYEKGHIWALVLAVPFLVAHLLVLLMILRSMNRVVPDGDFEAVGSDLLMAAQAAFLN